MTSALLALLLMSLQLQPVVGAVACLAADRSSESHCPMPDEAPAADLTIGEPTAPDTHGCFNTQLCTPATPAVLARAAACTFPGPISPMLRIIPRSFHLGLPATPPFHPPRI